MTRAGFIPGNIYAIEGPVRLLRDFGQHWQKRERREWLLGLARQLERERVLLSVSGHMILTATKPIGAPLRILNELPKKFHD